MELRQVEYFLALSETPHFTQVAERLGISQSTLSHQIRALEKQLKVPLFDRIGREVRLTAAGQAFLEPARRALEELETGRYAIAEVQGARGGLVRVGVSHVFSTRLIPHVVNEFSNRHPAVTLAISKVGGLGVRNGVLSGRFDLGITYTARGFDELESEVIFRDDLVVVTPPGHALSGRGPIPPSLLGDTPLVLTDVECTGRRCLNRYLDKAKIEPLVKVEINDIHAVLETVRRGKLATVLSRQSIVASDGLNLIEFVEPRPTLPAILIWRKGVYHAPAVQAFREVVLETESKCFDEVERNDVDVEFGP